MIRCLVSCELIEVSETISIHNNPKFKPHKEIVMKQALSVMVVLFALSATVQVQADVPAKLKSLPVVYEEDFEKGAGNWQPTDAKAWKVDKVGKNKVYNQYVRRSKYNPPHRSPYNISLLKGIKVKSFVLDAKVKSTIKDYGHRDVCLFFGYQNPAHFYYVHLGKKADPHANQIFIVNDAPRIKISTKTTTGTNWDDEWHHVRIVRDAKSGSIEVYFDDMKTPVMTATNRTFDWGQIGLGSFDDTGIWDDVVLRGEKVSK